jgi:queuine tRNA-ribosyltransferase
VRLVDRIRASLHSGDFAALREETTGAYYGSPR